MSPNTLDMEFHIETPRLTISCFDTASDAHADFLLELYNAPATVAATRRAPIRMPDREAARLNMEENNERIASHGYGRYLVCLKPTASLEPSALPFSQRVKSYTMVGIVSCKVRKFAGAPPVPDVGYGLLQAFHGKGYATEATRALMTHLEEARGQKEFFGYCDPNNEASKAVLTRLGFEKMGVRGVVGLEKDVLWALVWGRNLTKTLDEYGFLEQREGEGEGDQEAR